MDTKSIIVDASTYEAFLRWRHEHGHEVEDEAPEPVQQEPDEDTTPPVQTVTTGSPDAHGFVPSSVDVVVQVGGRYGEAAAPAVEVEADVEVEDEADAGMQPARQRSPRLNPLTAEAIVVQAMMTDYTAGWTIRPPRYPVTQYGNNDWTARGLPEAVTANGNTMSVSQIRSALTRLEAKGFVCTDRKCGKQERWVFTNVGLRTYNITPGVTPITAP